MSNKNPDALLQEMLARKLKEMGIDAEVRVAQVEVGAPAPDAQEIPGMPPGLTSLFGEREEARPAGPVPATREQALRLMAARAEGQQLKVGDTVVWRDGLKSAKWPDYGQQCVVTQVLPAPLHTGEAGTPIIAEADDIALAFTLPDGDLVEFLHDSRRFTKVASILN